METVRKAVILKRLKAQITKLHYKEGQKIAVNMEENELRGEEICLYYYIRARKKQTQGTIQQIQDADGRIYTTTRDIMRVVTLLLREKYKVIEADTTNVKELMGNIRTKIHREAKEAMKAPIMMEELETAVRMGKSNKAPGGDGINTDFFKVM